MPELPEVQTVVNGLQILTGDTFTGFESTWPKSLQKISCADFVKQINGKKILSIERIGKFVVFNLSRNFSILIHLRMTGQLIVQIKKLKVKSKHVHHVFYLKKNGALEFHDIRKFGTIALLPTDKISTYEKITVLGIDALDQKLNSEKLSELLGKNPGKQIKDFLMRQDYISGIGNIYASEILFDAKILPTRLCKNITPNETGILISSTKKILRKAIRMRGTSVSDYRDSQGQKGTFQNVLKVYKKNGQKCKICGTIIEKIIIGQRSTFYCPKCQI